MLYFKNTSLVREGLGAWGVGEAVGHGSTSQEKGFGVFTTAVGYQVPNVDVYPALPGARSHWFT